MPTQLADSLARHSPDILTALLHQARDCIKLIDRDGRVVFMNANGQHAMEICDFDLVNGRVWATIWPAEMQETVAQAVRQCLSGEEARFDGMCPTMGGQQRWWNVAVTPVRDQDGVVTHCLAVSRDVTATFQLDQASQRLARAENTVAFEQTKVGEMQHRLKNLLTVVSALVKLQARSVKSTTELVQSVDQRLEALGRAQNLLVGGKQEATIEEAAVGLLDDLGRIDSIRVDCRLSRRIGPQPIETLALLLSELQTNAIKHGALSHPDGKVNLEIAPFDDDHAAIEWRENWAAHGTRGTPSTGLLLLERLGSAAAPASFDWTPSGLTARLTVQL